MSSDYPESDGSSEHRNKTINQAIHFHVEHNQKGWFYTLLKIHFDIMSSLNASIGFSIFELHYSHSLQVLPTLISVLELCKSDPSTNTADARALLDNIASTEHEVRDNMALTKVH